MSRSLCDSCRKARLGCEFVASGVVECQMASGPKRLAVRPPSHPAPPVSFPSSSGTELDAWARATLKGRPAVSGRSR